jgi:ferredoxin
MICIGCVNCETLQQSDSDPFRVEERGEAAVD